MSLQQMKTSQQGINAIKQHEKFVGQTYRDSGGIETIGYGFTGKINGKPIKMGMSITKEEAEAELQRRLNEFENSVRSSVKAPLTQNQYDALVSLAYNIGSGAFSDSTLVKKLNAGDIEGAAEQFMAWRKVKGEDNQGLINRRNREREMFLGVGVGEDPNNPMPMQYETPYDYTPQTNPSNLHANLFNTELNQPQNSLNPQLFNQPLNEIQDLPNTPNTSAQYQKQLAQAFGIKPKASEGLPDYIGELVRSIYEQA